MVSVFNLPSRISFILIPGVRITYFEEATGLPRPLSDNEIAAEHNATYCTSPQWPTIVHSVARIVSLFKLRITEIKTF